MKLQRLKTVSIWSNVLKPGGIRDYRLTKHMNSIPREAFISGTARDLAYADLQLQCAAGETSRTMLTPTALALLIELADVQPEDVVLDTLVVQAIQPPFWPDWPLPSSRLKMMKRLTKRPVRFGRSWALIMRWPFAGRCRRPG